MVCQSVGLAGSFGLDVGRGGLDDAPTLGQGDGIVFDQPPIAAGDTPGDDAIAQVGRDPQQRIIDREILVFADTDFQVNVRAADIARAADQPDHVARFDVLALFDQDGGHMRVERLDLLAPVAEIVLDDDAQPVRGVNVEVAALR